MFFRGGFFVRSMLVLLLVGIFASVAGRWSYNAGWTDGYVSAQSSDGEAAAPSAPQAAPTRGWGFGPLGWFFGGLLKFWLFLLLAGLGLKLLAWSAFGGWRHRGHDEWHERRDQSRRRHGGRHYDHEGWPHEWRGRDEYDAPREKGPEDVEPDIRGA